MTPQTLLVLDVLMTSSARELSGADIGRIAKLPSGTLYPILLRLEQAKWAESRWECEEPQELGRPRKRYYQVTAQGILAARKAARDLAPAIERLAWN